jgi:hypothetical protein
VVVGLRGNDLLLNLRQQQLRFGQRQTQVGDLTEVIWPADLHHVKTSRLAVNPGPNQTQRPFHPRVPNRQHTRLVVSLLS